MPGRLSFWTTPDGLEAEVERMTIKNTGNVGIGDTTPDAFLEVLGTTEKFRLTNTDGTIDTRFTVDSSGNLTLDASSDGTGSQTFTLTGFSTFACATCIDGDELAASIAGRSLTLTAASPDVIDIDSEIYTRTKNITILYPSSTAETSKVHLQLPTKATLTRVTCHMDDSQSTTIQINWRDQSTPNTAGTNTLSASLDCAGTTGSTTAFAAATIDARDFLNVQITAASTTGDSGYLSIGIEHTVDD